MWFPAEEAHVLLWCMTTLILATCSPAQSMSPEQFLMLSEAQGCSGSVVFLGISPSDCRRINHKTFYIVDASYLSSFLSLHSCNQHPSHIKLPTLPHSPSLSHISEPLCTPLLLSRMPLHVPSLAGGKVTPPPQNSHVLIPEQAMLHSMEKKLRIFWHRIKLNILIWRDYAGLSGDAMCNPQCPLMREAEGDLTYTEERAMWRWRQRLEWPRNASNPPWVPVSWTPYTFPQ